MRKMLPAAVLAALCLNTHANPVTVTTTGAQPISNSTHRIVAGTVTLPGEGFWFMDPRDNVDAPAEIYLVPSDEAIRQMRGERMHQVETDRSIQQGQHALRRLYWAARNVARTNNSAGPASLSVLTNEHTRIDPMQCPWSGDYADTEGPFFYLIPDLTFRFDDDGRRVPRNQRDILAFELRPFVDDGKHWVQFTDGTCERQDIAPELLARHGQSIRPVTKLADLNRPPEAVLDYQLVAVIQPNAPETLSLQLSNRITDDDLSVEWPLPKEPVPGDDLADMLEKARNRQWVSLARITESGTLARWAGHSLRDDRRRNRQAASVFGILGGRPAIEETLQMQLLQAAPDQGEQTVSIGSIEGVTVQSHPYKTMLGDTQVEPPAILCAVPSDHLVLHIPRPAALLPFLDGGADFVAGLGSTATGSSIRYDLKKRYLARLGLNATWLENLLKAGVVTEMAMFAPDMFFIDGTDITTVSRVIQPRILTGLLKMVGVSGLGQKTVAVRTPAGREVFWALRGDLLVVSTSRAEAELALSLMKDDSASMARSTEYQYMLSQVPLQESTRMMLYFSDPFIRRLVSPAVKIAQLRRTFARARMEVVTTAALRARLDGVQARDIADLKAGGYLPGGLDIGNITLDAEGRAVSPDYGTLADSASLSAVPVERVTADEAEAYRSYLENYNRFWRQFFDPIAIRIDDTDDGGLEMTTFILPLIDNSLYDNVKRFLAHTGSTPLKVPDAKPDPVLMLSLNLAEPAWTELSKGLSELFMRYIFLQPSAIDDLGPALHFAIYDADPVIALGSGDILGAFGGGMQFFRRGEMFMIPVALSVLTRPCAFIIETQNPERTARMLDQAAAAALSGMGRRERDFSAEFYRIDNENMWVYSFGVMGMIKLRFGIQIEGDYVVIRNIPWSSRDTIVAVDRSPLCTARLAVNPAACHEQLPGLYSAAMEKEREAAMEGIGQLYPLMLARDLPVAEAIETHSELFGFRPVHPGRGSWTGSARTLESSAFGPAYRQRQPSYQPDAAAFGLFSDVERLNVSMEFQDEGLRSVLQWKMRKAE